MVASSNSSHPRLFNPLLTATRNWTNQQQCAAIASFGVDDRDINGQVFTSKNAGLSQIQRQRTRVLLRSLQTSVGLHIRSIV